jgi:PhzF family phenazine biosynthesis protein
LLVPIIYLDFVSGHEQKIAPKFIMSIPYYQVDAFTGSLFSGNPAGVAILADWLADEVLQSIAAENGLAETAFVVPRGASFDLRWFTPEIEVDLCGHATLAAAHVLFTHLGYRSVTVEFQTRSGLLPVTRSEALLTLDFPSRPAVACEAPPELAEGLGAKPIEVYKSRDFLAVFEKESDVRSLQPKMNVMAKLPCLGIIATAPGTACDFVSRFFAPAAGVPEDPVTGSAHCTLIPYWAKRLKRSPLQALQVSKRGGELFCAERGDRVGISGRAVTYSTGFLHVD